MKKILVPIDGSAASKRAAAQAFEMSKCLGATVTYLTVVEGRDALYSDYSGTVSREYLESKERLHQEDMQRASTMLDSVCDSICGCASVDRKVLSGEPHPVIVKYAQDEKVDMIVMGTRGLNPIQRLFAGSVAVKVLEDATCPVLFVK